MENTRVDENRNNNSEMEGEFDNCMDDKVCVYETVIGGGFMNEELYDTDNNYRNIHNYVSIKDENLDGRIVIGFIDEKPCKTEYKQASTDNYVSIKGENIDDLNVVIPDTELITDCIDNKVCLNKTEISRGYITQESCGMKDEQGSIQNYLCIKDENIDHLTVVAQETELKTDYIDTKVCVYETIISGGFIKKEPDDMGNVTERIHNNIDMKDCQECGAEYDLYCLKCPMLIRILDNNNPDRRDNTVRRTLPKNFLDICETQSGLGVVALRTIPKGVVFGPFKGVDLTKDEVISKWILKNNELAVIKYPEWSNWMQCIRRVNKYSHQNLVPFQYENGLYYRSDCYIRMGDELLVRWDNDDKESEIQDMEDSYWVPEVCESLDDSYACTFCCVGYKLISHLIAHNSTCIEKRNKKDFCNEIVQCDICKIYLDKKECSDYHMDRCSTRDGKCDFNRGRPLHNGNKLFSCTLCPYKATRKSNLKQHMAIHSDDRPQACSLCPFKTKTRSSLIKHIAVHNGDKPIACTLCSFKTKTNWDLKRHMAIHNNDRPFTCTVCPYKTTTKSNLKQHVVIHNDDKPFACSLCPYNTKTNSILKRHMAIHNNYRPFACTVCPYKATTKSNLKQHIIIHNDDKPFACPLCPYKTTTKSNLNQHIVIHNDDTPFACALCPYKTKTNSFLRRHMAVHNDDKAFACTVCPYKATTKSNLKQHVVIHNGHKP